MTEFLPTSTVFAVETLDDGDALEGYLDGFHATGNPDSSRSRAYWRGWNNGMIESGRIPYDASCAQVSRAFEALGLDLLSARRCSARTSRLATAELEAGDCAYIPCGCGHSEQNIGTEDSETVASLDNGVYEESTLSARLANAPRHLLANNFGIAEAAVPDFPKWGQSIVAKG